MSRRLILMRHAKSSWDDPAQPDHARPLNARGRRSAAALGTWLRGKGHLPDTVLCSDAARTRETCARLGLGVRPVKYLPALYHASTGVILDQLRQGGAGGTVLLVGHNPGCADFASRILAAPPDHERFHDFPTGATLVLDLPCASWEEAAFHTGRAVDFITPRELTV